MAGLLLHQTFFTSHPPLLLQASASASVAPPSSSRLLHSSFPPPFSHLYFLPTPPFFGPPLLPSPHPPSPHPPFSVRAETKSRGPSREEGGRWLNSVTRHVRIYAGYVDPATGVMDQSQLDKLTLMLDPDDEFVWDDGKCQKVYGHFKELIDNYAGAPLTEYTLRLIGSDLEHFIRKMLLAGELKYNLDCRVLNFSMGKPRLDIEEVEAETAP